ncbi:MAG: sugar ABC transporter ATP-binding protein, partial [Alphaproteobacteria bacterium]|nr:sugar ABC transporter ATP-binding protein [Alphaproteobacteria bacterium]
MNSASPGPTPILEVKNIDKSFPGVQALKDVSIEVRPHEVVGLIGENGAGKSTLMRIFAGVYPPDNGAVELRGETVSLKSPTDAAGHGIAMVFQEQSLLPNLTVGENIYLGAEGPFTRGGLVRWRALYAAAKRQLEKVQVDIDPTTPTAELDFAARQMVELAKALTLEEAAEGHLVILLDEPTSVLEQADIDILFERVRALKVRASFVFVSHRLDEVLALSDRVYVMKDGEVVADLVAADADVHQLHQLMVGRGRRSEYYRESDQAPYRSDVLLAVENLTLDRQYRHVDFELHAGEVLAIAGVIGSGREAVCRTLFGFDQPTTGRLLIGNRAVRLTSPSDAVDHGIGYIPRERRTEGLVLFLSVTANMTLASIEKVARRGVIDYGRERRLARSWVEKLNIRTPSLNALCLNLSGGNQQKVVLAKWMNAESRIVILDHPTRGLDVGAKEEVYELIRAISGEG